MDGRRTEGINVVRCSLPVLRRVDNYYGQRSRLQGDLFVMLDLVGMNIIAIIQLHADEPNVGLEHRFR